MKKRDGKKGGQWTTKSRAWLERRDDGAGKEGEKKKEDDGKGAIDGETGIENGEGRERKRKCRGSVVLMSSPASGRK